MCTTSALYTRSGQWTQTALHSTVAAAASAQEYLLSIINAFKFRYTIPETIYFESARSY